MALSPLRTLFISAFLFIGASFPGVPSGAWADMALSAANFRERYNAAAEPLKAATMPAERSESIEIPDKADKQKTLSTVQVYFLNERMSLLLNTPVDAPDTLLAVAVMAGGGDDYSLATATDVQTAMIAAITAVTPSLSAADRDALTAALGLTGGEDGDFTDGKPRSQTSGDLTFHTNANENNGVELLIRPVKK